MGLFSSNKQSLSQSLNQNVDGRVVAGPESQLQVNTVTGDGNSVVSTDHGAVWGALQANREAMAAAFDFGDDAIGQALSFGRQGLDFGETALKQSIGGMSRALSSNDTALRRAFDFGGDAMDGNLKLAMLGIEGVQKDAREAMQAASGIMDGALGMVADQQQAFQASQKETLSILEAIKTSDVRTLVIAGMVVVGVAALTLMKKG